MDEIFDLQTVEPVRGWGGVGGWGGRKDLKVKNGRIFDLQTVEPVRGWGGVGGVGWPERFEGQKWTRYLTFKLWSL